VKATISREATEFTLIPHAQLASRDNVIGQLSKIFRRLCRGDGPANPLYIEAIGTVLGTHILRALFGPDERSGRNGGLPDEALRRVMRYIDEHLAETLDLATLGSVACFSASHFGRLFKTSLGMPPHEYVMRRRVAKAEELLLGTDMKELEIAGLCGFSDDTLMARWFRRILDSLPSDVRSQPR
jgi:AraC family transcriptional regulator